MQQPKQFSKKKSEKVAKPGKKTGKAAKNQKKVKRKLQSGEYKKKKGE